MAEEKRIQIDVPPRMVGATADFGSRYSMRGVLAEPGEGGAIWLMATNGAGMAITKTHGILDRPVHIPRAILSAGNSPSPLVCESNLWLNETTHEYRVIKPSEEVHPPPRDTSIIPERTSEHVSITLRLKNLIAFARAVAQSNGSSEPPTITLSFKPGSARAVILTSPDSPSTIGLLMPVRNGSVQKELDSYDALREKYLAMITARESAHG